MLKIAQICSEVCCLNLTQRIILLGTFSEVVMGSAQGPTDQWLNPSGFYFPQYLLILDQKGVLSDSWANFRHSYSNLK